MNRWTQKLKGYWVDYKEKIKMFLLGFFVTIALGVILEISDTYKANQYNKNDDFYTKYSCFKPKPWEHEKIDKNK